MTARAERRERREGLGQRFRLHAQEFLGDLPGLSLGQGKLRSLPKQGADTIGPDLGGGMVPAEESDPAVPLGQDVLEETPDQFVGFQILVGPLTGIALAIGPADFAVGQQFEAAIARGGFEDVAGQVVQGIFSGTHGLDVDIPLLFPNLARDLSKEFRGLFLQELGEKGADMSLERGQGEEELGAGVGPGAAIEGEAAAGDEVMDVGMEDEGAAPGVEDAEQGQLRVEVFGMGGQVLQGPGAGGEEQVAAEFEMRSDPVTERVGQGEGDQEIGEREQQTRSLPLQPLVGVGLAAERTIAVVAGMVEEMEARALWAGEEVAAQSRGAAAQDPLEDLALPVGHGRAELLEISGTELAQQLVKSDRAVGAWRGQGQLHEREIKDRS